MESTKQQRESFNGYMKCCKTRFYDYICIINTKTDLCHEKKLYYCNHFAVVIVL